MAPITRGDGRTMARIFGRASRKPFDGCSGVVLECCQRSSTDMIRAKNDCFQVFGPFGSVSISGPLLPGAGRMMSISIIYDITTPFPNVEGPRTITVSKGFRFRIPPNRILYSFRERMKDRHSNSLLGLRLFMSLPDKYYIKRSIIFNLTSPVSYLSRYGLVNLEHLRTLASTGSNPDILKHLLPLCHEREWYLLGPNPMSRTFSVNRVTNRVLTSRSPPTYTPMRTFLEDHLEAKSYLDSQVNHDPEKLFIMDPTETLPHSCGGAVEASSNGVRFRFQFSHLPKSSLRLETKKGEATGGDERIGGGAGRGEVEQAPACVEQQGGRHPYQISFHEVSNRSRAVAIPRLWT
ncbi:hypothetical protein N657DRAFT_631241 [Parathielavia appendiculata]|uniref:Uncharacterized protein n=1 Tax=Parathielavia appendiculata TaxID=2587402 RepID=A0AAN6U6R2_9PEZI|nr:hypothetical protein N657DRAFT_631241 [Parathielavia appendiculata]